MISNRKRGLKLLKWRMECLGYSLIEAFACLLPGPWVFRLGEAIAGVVWHFMPKRRKMILRNLRIAFAGEYDLPTLRKMAKASFCRTGGNLISAAYTAKISPEKLSKVIHIENLELIEKPIKEGRGVVLLLSHMGNWELLSRLVHLFPEGAKTGAFYRPLNNEIMDARVLARRQADGTRMFSKRDPFHQVTGFLRDGGVVGILADQRMAMQGELIHFFGRLTRASPLPSLLARRAKAEVLALSLTTERPGKWRAVFLPVESPPTTTHCMAALEAAMKTGPMDVFWLQERWRIRLNSAHMMEHFLGKDAGDGRKPHRALLWLIGVPESWSVPRSWLHPDVVYEVALTSGHPLPSWLPESTRVHHVKSGLNPPAYADAINEIDESAELPLDYILTDQISGELFKFCRQQAIPVFSAAWRPIGEASD